MSDRIRRPPLDRTEPIRAWSALFGAGPLNDVVTRSVELGYRVVDEYIRQGQKAAARVGSRSFGAETMTSDVQDLSVRMVQYTSDVIGLWFEMMNVFMAGGLARPNGNGATERPEAPSAPPAAAPAPEGVRVRVEIVSARPADVAVDLRPEAAGRPLAVHGLRAVDPTKPRLDGVEIAADADGVTVRVRVPDDAPPAVYNGLVVDEETSRPAGTVSVRIAPA
ncbi:MAG TPA: hypothetical protein VKA21_08455 [Candidatus Binatia bacterium]|nr:hypothetical protein [Candidatus Binatia bacterium]